MMKNQKKNRNIAKHLEIKNTAYEDEKNTEDNIGNSNGICCQSDS